MGCLTEDEMDYTMDFEDLDKHFFPLVGGKNAGLGEMMRAGIRVPPGFAVTTEGYQDFIAEAGIGPRIFKILSDLDPEDITSINAASTEIQGLIMKPSISGEILESIERGYSRLNRKCIADAVPVAVRSSATAEDLPTASFAGLHDTYLWVKNPDRVVESIHRCWASLFTPRAIDYRIKKRFTHEKVLMSVGVQKMVNSRAAGVLFTLNPTNGDPSKVVIEGNWGLGETVVSGSVNPDKFVVDKVMKEIDQKKVSAKHLESLYDPKRGEVVEVDLPEEMQLQCCLNEEEVEALFDIAKKIESHYGRPMDVEWAIDADTAFPETVFVVQARPETVWSQRKAEPVLGRKTGLQLFFGLIERGMKGIKIPY
jgi:pyruvate,water dikinase